MRQRRASRRVVRHRFLPTVLGFLFVLAPSSAQDEPDQQLEAAIAVLRHIDPAQLSDEQKQLKVTEIDRAWQVLQAAGSKGAARLKREIAAVDQGEEKDDFFKLNAAHLLWRIARLDEGPAIAAVWSNTPLDAQYNYVFDAATDAARTQDPRALPMLEAILHDDKGSVYVEQHALNVSWPLTHMVIWETFGPSGLPALLGVLQKSRNPVELQSAVMLLAKAHYLEALPAIRRLAEDGEGEPRLRAIEAVGEFGHPQDYEFLLRGLRSAAGKLRSAHADALARYGDRRAVPALAELLPTDDADCRASAIDALANLLTAESLDALHGHAQSAKDDDERRQCNAVVDAVLSRLHLDWSAFAALPRPEQERLVAGVDQREDAYRLRPDDRTLTHADLLEAAKDWQQRHRITGGPYEWVESRHALAAATPDDLDLFRQVRAAVYWRVSDECLDEVYILNDVIQRLGRSRYRKNVGVCSSVEPLAGPAAPPSSGPAEPAAPPPSSGPSRSSP